MGKVVIALDQGTTSSRAIVFDERGRIVSVAQEAFKQYFPRNGWVEHDPLEILDSQQRCLETVISGSGIDVQDVVAIGITNQRETTIIWDRKTGKPVYPAIVWQDRRTANECSRLKKNGAEEFVRKKTGLVLDPYFSATKISWILDHVEGARKAAEAGRLAFGTVDTWLIWNLTSGRVHATDASNASRTLLLDLETGSWDADLLRLFGVPASVLPEVKDSSSRFGLTSLSGKDVPISGVAGDQQAALFGQGCFERGSAKNTYGTGCFLLMNQGDAPVLSRNGLVTTVAWQLQGKRTFALEGSVFIAGAVVQWLRDEMGIITDSAHIETLASTVADTGGLCFVPAFSGLGAPHWDPNARGLLIGLTRATSRAHIARAALEAIAFQSADVLESMEKDAGVPLRSVRVDGGASANNLLLQIQADLLGTSVLRPSQIESTALGAARLAGLAEGFWTMADFLADTDREEFIPQIGTEERKARRTMWQQAVNLSRGWAEGS